MLRLYWVRLWLEVGLRNRIVSSIRLSVASTVGLRIDWLRIRVDGLRWNSWNDYSAVYAWI